MLDEGVSHLGQHPGQVASGQPLVQGARHRAAQFQILVKLPDHRIYLGAIDTQGLQAIILFDQCVFGLVGDAINQHSQGEDAGNCFRTIDRVSTHERLLF